VGRFDERASVPRRGPGDIFKWKVVDAIAGRNRRPAPPFITPSRPYDPDIVTGLGPQLTWIGHASFLFTVSGKRLLVDPILRMNLGPLRRLAPIGIPAAELPTIDYVLVTHNHRDHLDPKSLAMIPGAPTFVTPLGNADVLRAAGAKEVLELDWWQRHDAGALDITLVPARHWSMRFPWDRNDALWGGFVIRGQEGTFYHSGDTGFEEAMFADIGARVGAIDWAMLPIGAYEPRWFMEPQHMGPEEAVRACLSLGAQHLVAMHWGTYKLTDEPLAEPPERARLAHKELVGADERLLLLDVGETRKLGR
jgi:L-ascorbate metabolism protein UlaG (beta-lactamase superfamily)